MAQIPISPMLCSTGQPDQLRHIGIEWIAEPKLDGERIIAERRAGVIYLWTRRESNVAKKFPEVVEALKTAALAQDWVLDGELTVAGGFQFLLMRNTDDKLKISILSKKMPATFYVFDVLKVGEAYLTAKPLVERKEMLDRLVKDTERVKAIIGVPGTEAQHMFEQEVERGHEGIVVKKLSSLYDGGQRSQDWRKFKRSDTVDVYVVGATRSDSGLAFGALVLMKDGMYFGKVGTGFSDDDRSEILEMLGQHTDDIQAIHMPDKVRDELILLCNPMPAEVKIQERMANGSPRHPVWVRWRWNDAGEP